MDQLRDPRLFRFCRLVFGLALSTALGLLAPIAAEAISGLESLEDELHGAGARMRARLVRQEISPRAPARVERDASLRQPRRATAERLDQSIVNVRARKIPSLIPDSPTALPDH
jgi:hypothetical protein